MQAIEEFSRLREHSNYHSTIVVVLTHGEHGKLGGTDMDCAQNQLYGTVGVHRFVSTLNAENCPQLRGKPKLFFLQACRGSKLLRLLQIAFISRWF